VDYKRLLFGSIFISAGLAIARKLFASQAPANPTIKNSAYDAIDAYIIGQMKRLHIPGASLAIVEGDQAVYFRGFGEARPGGEVPTPQTPFFLGSVTKSFTALAVMQLVEAGKVELDAAVQHYLPWFRVADPVASSKMTVRHLLNQTSGFSMMSSQLALAELDDRPGAAERQIRALSKLKLNHPVGEKCQYCNLNYTILGLIIEATSGEDYGSYIQKHIFEPLEMNHSYISKAAAKKNGLAVGYRHWFSLPFPDAQVPLPIGSMAAGLLISCAEDMSHYLNAHLNGGRYRGVQILSAAGIDETHRGIAELIQWHGSTIKYGMGWFDSDLGPTKTYAHGGNLPEYSAYMGLVPSEKKAFALLMNADPYGLPFITDEIGMGPTALLAGQLPPPIRMNFIQWIFRSLPLIPLIQAIGVTITLRTLVRWKTHPASLPSRGRLWRQHILLPLVPNLSLAALLSFLQLNGLIRFMHLYMPDLAWVIRLSGGFAGVWAVLRTRWVWQTWRKSHRIN
jgi:CubicO group peptidase (beta-lactamase class C family)